MGWRVEGRDLKKVKFANIYNGTKICKNIFYFVLVGSGVGGG